MQPARVGWLKRANVLFGNMYLYTFMHFQHILLEMKETEASPCFISISSNDQWCIAVFTLQVSERLIVFIIINMVPQTCTLEKPDS
jgi:hypothetical protein